MKSIYLSFIFAMLTANLFAQKETFDVFTYQPIKNWNQEKTDKSVTFTSMDEAKGAFCIIRLYPSLDGDADSKINFDNSWKSIVQEPLGAGDAKMEDISAEDGWKLQTGSAQFNKDGLAGIAMLVTATNSSKMVNMLVMFNADSYTKALNDFISSIKLSAVAAKNNNTSIRNNQPVSNSNNSSIVGLWTNYILETTGYNVGGMPQYTAGYLRKEYQFNANGTYTFRNKQWLTKAADITFLYETGSYTVNGNQLTIIPANGKGGFWAKTNSSKEWGKLKKYTDYKLEKTTYTFEIINDPTYGNGIILKPGKPTNRDGGKFNAPNDPYEFRYSFRNKESLIDNPPGFKLSEAANVSEKNTLSNSANSILAGKIFESTSPEKSGSGNMQYKTGGYWTWQYQFYNDGTYRFVYVAASHFNETKLLQYETGTYTVQGNQVIISPGKGANEEWSKIGKTSNGNSDVNNRAINDTWNKKLKISNRNLEKITYPFSIEYWESNKANVLALQHANDTVRDGSPANNNNSYYFEITSGKSDLSLPKGF
ncbi:MAG TPA: hypothetical protein PKN06_11915 [Chitinophagaceae bacterium]|nr:hypothetical protein [Chitinophagaceae bacterium]